MKLRISPVIWVDYFPRSSLCIFYCVYIVAGSVYCPLFDDICAIAFSVWPLLLKEILPLYSVTVAGNLSGAWPLTLKETLPLSLALSLLFCFQSSLSSLTWSWTHDFEKASDECTQGTFSQIELTHEILLAELEYESVFMVDTDRQEYCENRLHVGVGLAHTCPSYTCQVLKFLYGGSQL